jgi:hypothetical protein
VLSLFSGQTVVASNDDWGSATNAAQIATTGSGLGAFNLGSTSLDAVTLTTLPSGAYSAQVVGKAGATGVALIEIYDAAAGGSSRLVNISGRSSVGGTAGPLIAGFAVAGNAPRQLLIRAIGPTLSTFGVGGVLADPFLELYQGSSRLQQNDNWGGGAALTSAFAQVGAFAISDPASKDAVLLVTLQPGSYSAVVSSANGQPGVVLVEVYVLP